MKRRIWASVQDDNLWPRAWSGTPASCCGVVATSLGATELGETSLGATGVAAMGRGGMLLIVLARGGRREWTPRATLPLRPGPDPGPPVGEAVSYTHLRAHETRH